MSVLIRSDLGKWVVPQQRQVADHRSHFLFSFHPKCQSSFPVNDIEIASALTLLLVRWQAELSLATAASDPAAPRKSFEPRVSIGKNTKNAREHQLETKKKICFVQCYREHIILWDFYINIYFLKIALKINFKNTWFYILAGKPEEFPPAYWDIKRDC